MRCQCEEESAARRAVCVQAYPADWYCPCGDSMRPHSDMLASTGNGSSLLSSLLSVLPSVLLLLLSSP